MYNFLALNTTSSILILLVLISFFCVFLFIENHKLHDKVKKLELENRKLLEKKITKQKSVDSIPINKISTNDKKQTNNQDNNKQELITKQPVKETSKSPMKDGIKEKIQKYEKEQDSRVVDNYHINKSETKKLYQKNVLHDKPNITSPVSITKPEEYDFDLNEFIKTNELKVKNTTSHKISSKPKETVASFNQTNKANKELLSKINYQSMPSKDTFDKLDSSINRAAKNIITQTNQSTTDSLLKELKTIKNQNNNIDYLQEISNKMADELKPQTIELTDYEKMQEENAIISYKELITLKDTLMMLDDEDETVNFIEELKKLRNSLK